MTVDENILLWWVALGLGVVVILVATILLMMIIGNAKTCLLYTSPSPRDRG